LLTFLQITSKFPVHVIRRLVPNSHDQFRNARQAQKSAMQLAVNAEDPVVRRLLVQLLHKIRLLGPLLPWTGFTAAVKNAYDTQH
jgi:hypothetical protein